MDDFTFVHDIEYSDALIPFSEDVYKYLKSLGYHLISKLGQGLESAAFLTRMNNGKEVAVVIRGGLCDNMYKSKLSKIYSLQQSGALSTKYVVEIITYIIYIGPLSDDPTYCDESERKDMSKHISVFDVLELATQTISEFIFHGIERGDNSQMKIDNILNIMTQLKEALIDIDKAGLVHYDLILDNVGFIGDSFVLIDLKSLHAKPKDRRGMKHVNGALRVFYNDLTSIYVQPTELDLISKSWKWIRGYMSDINEQFKVRKYLYQHIRRLYIR